MGKITHFIKHYKLHYSIVFLFLSTLFLHIYENSFGYNISIFNQVSITLAKIISLIAFLVISVLLFLFVYYSDTTGGRNVLMDMRLSGRSFWECLVYYKNADPYKLDIKKYPICSWREFDGVVLGKVKDRLIGRSATEANNDGANFALFALPGGGKTSSQLIPTALRFNGSVLSIDIKGDILKVTQSERKIKVFAPDNAEISCTYNPIADVSDMSVSEQKVFLERMAAVIIPEEKDGKYFSDGARDFFCAIALYLISENINTTLPEIATAILHGNAIDWVIKIKESECSSAQEYTNSYYGSNEKNVAGAYGSAAKAMRPFCSGDLSKLLVDGPDSISPQSLDEGCDVYIEIPQDKIQIYSPISALLVQNFMLAFMSRPDKSSGIMSRPVLFLLDEYPQIALPFPVISAGLSTLRSKSVSIFIACQSIGQLINRYSESCCRELIDCCAYISVMSAQDPQSRQFFSSLIGSRKVLKMTNSSGTDSIGAQETREPIFFDEDFANLEDQVIICASGRYVKADKTYYFQ